MNRRRFSRRGFLIGGLALGATLLGGSYALVSNLQAATAEPLPKYAYRTRDTARAYRVALARGDLLAQINCYCGCDQIDPPHHSLRDCYVKPAGGFEEHAAWCEICQQEVLDVDRWAGEGAAPAEIGRRIDAEYGPPAPEAAPPRSTHDQGQGH